jgi:hypothetical protein
VIAVRPARALHLAGALALASALALGAGPARAQGLQLALAPALQGVSPGDTFTVTLEVPQAGADFNAVHAVVHWDSSAVHFVPTSPLDAQLGCLMTGACSAACGQTYHTFSASPESASIFASLLCDAIQLTGPGTFYRLRFRAVGAQQTTSLTLSGVLVYDAGVSVNPVTASPCSIAIGAPLAVAGRAGMGAPRLRASPVPARGAVTLAVEAAAAGPQRLEVLDVTGRRLRTLADGWVPAGARTLGWDGTDEAGRRLPAGVYLVRLAAGSSEVRARVVLVR